MSIRTGGGSTSGYRARHKRLRAVVAGLLFLPWATGCYTYVPLWQGTPQTGTLIAVGLSDRGRAELANRIGPGARQLTGRVAGLSDSSLTLAVSSVTYIGPGTPMIWNGEMVVIPRDVVSGIQERRLSKTRSWLAAGAAVAAIALISTLAITGFGSDPPSDRLPGGNNPQ